MTTGQRLEHHSLLLLIGLAHGASGADIYQLVANVRHALADSFANGDKIRIVGTHRILTTRVQVLNALKQSRMIEVDSAPSAFGEC